MSEDVERRLWRFLLGEASEDEQLTIEDELFLAQDRLATIEVAEDELIDAYARGELAPEQRRRFEERYLRTDRQRARVLFAGALAQAARVKRAPASSRRWLRPSQWSAAAAAVVVVALAALVSRLGGRDLVIDASLAPTMLRNESKTTTLHLPARLSRLQLHLALNEPLPQDGALEVVLRRGADEPRTFPASAAAGGITVLIAGKDIPDGMYELTARVRRHGTATEDLAVYAFRVIVP